jgi:uncharacterized protein (UPF0335 family)
MARGRPRKQKPIPPPPRDVTKDDNSSALRQVVESIGRIEGEIRSKKSEYAVFVKNQRKLINGHLDIAANQGFSKKVIKSIVKARELEGKLDNLREKLDEDDLGQSYDDYRQALGDFADTPLGAAGSPPKPKQDALSGLGDEDDERDLRPPHLKQSESDRLAEENAKRLEQGISPLPN